jgi:hypothetical protein
MAGFEDKRGVVVGGQVGEVRTGGWVGGQVVDRAVGCKNPAVRG